MGGAGRGRAGGNESWLDDSAVGGASRVRGERAVSLKGTISTKPQNVFDGWILTSMQIDWSLAGALAGMLAGGAHL